jgi:hypothetical protein
MHRSEARFDQRTCRPERFAARFTRDGDSIGPIKQISGGGHGGRDVEHLAMADYDDRRTINGCQPPDASNQQCVFEIIGKA